MPMEPGYIVAGVGLISGLVGTVAGSKVAVSLLQRAHERFEDAVWKTFDGEREKMGKIAERVAKVEAVCDNRKKEGIC